MRYILHCDCNNFYASVEMLYNPKIRHLPVIVVGDAEKRHGVVLSKNEVAKKLGVKTGDTIYDSKIKCGSKMVSINANFTRYRVVSKQINSFYRRICPLVESFGIDESWLDISHLVDNFEKAYSFAESLRKEVKEKFGITISIGVSFNKIFAKLGSDYKKPDATTLISPDNFRDIVWKLPANSLVYVGKSTYKKLLKVGIKTIGDLAQADKEFLASLLGKNGLTLHAFAGGYEQAEVTRTAPVEKSIGNSTTCPRDLKTNEEVSAIIYVLCESVVQRMREKGFWCEEVSLHIKDSTLESCDKQKKLDYPINTVKDMSARCIELFKESYNWNNTVRAVGVRVSKLCKKPHQLNMFVDNQKVQKDIKLEQTVEEIRSKYGYNIIMRGNVAKDKDFEFINPSVGIHKIYPASYIK